MSKVTAQYSNWFPHNNFKKVGRILNILDMLVDDTKIQVKFEFEVRRSKVTAHYIFKLVSTQ